MSVVRAVARGPETLFGVGRVDQPDPGTDRVTGSMPAALLAGGPDGAPCLGALGVLADDVLGFSIIASLSPGRWTVSTEIWLDLLAPLPTEGLVHADAATVSVGSFATGTVTDASGGLLAVIRERGRPVPVSHDDLELAPPPGLHDVAGGDVMGLLGLQPRGDDTLLLEVVPAWENPRGMLHGGISLCASELAATWARRAAGSELATSSVHIVHARGIPSGSCVEFTARPRHAGRSLFVTDVVGSVDGRVATIARVSAETARAEPADAEPAR